MTDEKKQGYWRWLWKGFRSWIGATDAGFIASLVLGNAAMVLLAVHVHPWTLVLTIPVTILSAIYFVYLDSEI